MPKLNSNGFKPLVIGRFKTRSGLVNAIVRLEATGVSQESMEESCGVSQSLISQIVCLNRAEINAGAGI